jgi:DNA polymerase-1
MVMAWLLQLEQQGLKPLCVRHHGMRMQSFDEVMGDAQERLMNDYLTWIWDAEEFDYEERQQAAFAAINATPLVDKQSGRPKHDKQGRVRYRRTTKPPNVPKTPLHKAVVRCLGSKNATKLWSDQVEDIQVAGYHRMGEPPQATLDYIPRAAAVRYGCRDSDGTTRVRHTLRPRVHDMGLDEVYALELSTIPLIDRMSQVGIKPDLDHFAYVSEGLGYEIESLKWELERETGITGFNANSGDQVEAFLAPFGVMEGMRRTSSGRFSTNDKILEALEHEHPELPVLSKIREYRETYKLKNTFVDRLPDFVHRWPDDGRVHATFRTTRVVTGRLAASEPNILAQPEHGKFAADFKRGWVPDDGHVLAAWDESQIELRGLAHLSQDPVMLAVFRGEKRNKDGSIIDLHAALAERIFGVKPHLQDKHKHRFPAKAVNFGIPMGMTCKGLAVELRKNGVYVTEEDAQRWLDETLGLYKGVARYMDTRIAEARLQGYVRCLSGRVRYIGGIRSSDERTRAEAERFAFSTPIQESAQFIMKQAEAQVWTMLKGWWREGLYVEPLYQQHDALKFEVQEGQEQRLHREVTRAMTQVPKGFTVPLEVEGEWGYNMADMTKFKEAA